MAAPNLAITVEPAAGPGKAFYLPIAAPYSTAKAQAKVVLRLRLKNNSAATLTLSSIEFSFPGSAHPAKSMQGVKIAVDTGVKPDPNDGKIGAGTTATWSNGVVDLDTSEAGENKIRNDLYLNRPAPPKVTVAVKCTGFTDAVSVTLDLVPFVDPTGAGALNLPFAPYDLAAGEYIVTGALHWANGGAGGTQIFAHDIGIQAKDGSEWSPRFPGKDNSKNEHHRIYGKPVRALADGSVLSFKNDTPNNPKPGEKLDVEPLEGNHFWLRHGNIKVKYAHLQMGSLTPALMQAGAVVRAGQQLGLAGNTGNSDGPHLHLEAHDASNDTLRGLPFKNGWVLLREKIKADQGGPWVRLTADGIPRDAVAIWPASTFPRTVVAAAGIARSGDWGNSYIAAADRAGFETQAQTLFEQHGRRLIHVATYLEAGQRRWLGIARDGDWASSFWVSNDRASFEAKAQNLFDTKGQRLIHVSTYPEGSARRWVGIARSGDWASSFWISNDRASFDAKAQNLFDTKGQRLVWLTTYREGTARRWVGLARSGDWASSYWVSNDRAAFEAQAQSLFDQQGRRLTHVHTFTEGDARRWVGLARSGDWANSYFFARDIDSFNRNAQNLFTENGRRLTHIEILDDEA
jgi:hypothetical protein